MKQTWPAPERNKHAICEVLQRVLPASGEVLEIASGSGQHAVYFATQLPGLTWQPSDVNAENLASITRWHEDTKLANLRAPLTIDVTSSPWPVGTVAAIFCANMLHIAPFACCTALFQGAARHLAPSGVLVTYGPYAVAGTHTAESNARFDADLRARDPRWGVRDVHDVEREAERVGMTLRERVPLPANNQCLVFVRNPKNAAAPA